jgi:hypothetical protein
LTLPPPVLIPVKYPERQTFSGRRWAQWVAEIIGATRCFPDLTRVTRNYFWLDWNDVISAFGPCRDYVTVWEHINHQGSSALIRPGDTVPYVGDGWNDRISSMCNWGAPRTTLMLPAARSLRTEPDV